MNIEDVDRDRKTSTMAARPSEFYFGVFQHAGFKHQAAGEQFRLPTTGAEEYLLADVLRVLTINNV